MADLSSKKSIISRAALGFIVAATGVGAGDLITASLAGSSVGVSILWAAWVGALLKFFLNEGLARWQMATNKTILEGWFCYLPSYLTWVFFLYFLLWSFYVGGALINACGVAGVGFFSFGHPGRARIIWGLIHSFAGLIIVWRGGFAFFQRVMTFFTGAMVLTVLYSAIRVSPPWPAIIKGLFIPMLPRQNISWLLGVMGGVGGTVTIICYNYWVKEKARSGWPGLKDCRFDLGIGYGLTAFFGLAMVIIGSRIVVSGRGDEVALQLARQLELTLGSGAKILFLLGFWSAVFSSLLGVWQGVPYIFADFLRWARWARLTKAKAFPSLPPSPAPATMKSSESLTRSPAYRFFLLGLTFLPLASLAFTVQKIQLIYAVLGALFMPFLAATLLLLNNRRDVLDPPFRNSWLVNLFLSLSLIFFTYLGLREILPLLTALF